MAHVQVIYPTERTVYIDGEDNGSTNTVLRVDEGTHLFDLGEPVDYEPESQEEVVADTTVLKPLTITFTPKAPA